MAKDEPADPEGLGEGQEEHGQRPEHEDDDQVHQVAHAPDGPRGIIILPLLLAANGGDRSPCFCCHAPNLCNHAVVVVHWYLIIRRRRGRIPVKITYLADRPARQLAVPLVLDLVNLAIASHVDEDGAVDGLVVSEPLDGVLVAQLHLDGVLGRRDFVGQDLDRVEDGGKAVPLRRVLVEAAGDGQGVGEGRVAVPEVEVFQGWVA